MNDNVDTGVTAHEERELNARLADLSRDLPAQHSLTAANAQLVALVAERAEVKQQLEDAIVIGSDTASLSKRSYRVESSIELAELQIAALGRRLRVEQLAALEKSVADGRFEATEAAIVRDGIRAQNIRLEADFRKALRDFDVADAEASNAALKVSRRTQMVQTFNRLHAVEVERTQRLMAGSSEVAAA